MQPLTIYVFSTCIANAVAQDNSSFVYNLYSAIFGAIDYEKHNCCKMIIAQEN